MHTQAQPRMGLMRPNKKPQPTLGGRVPPMVGRALAGPPKNGAGDNESPYPPRLIEMLEERGQMGESRALFIYMHAAL